MEIEERIAGVVVCFGSIFVLYLYLKLSGELMKPEYGVFRFIDGIVMFIIFDVIPYILLIGGSLFLVVYAIKEFVSSQIDPVAKELKYSRHNLFEQIENCRKDIRSNSTFVNDNFEKLKAQMKELNEEIKAMKMPVEEIKQEALQNFI